MLTLLFFKGYLEKELNRVVSDLNGGEHKGKSNCDRIHQITNEPFIHGAGNELQDFIFFEAASFVQMDGVFKSGTEDCFDDLKQ
jgi:hypothetical protein